MDVEESSDDSDSELDEKGTVSKLRVQTLAMFSVNAQGLIVQSVFQCK